MTKQALMVLLAVSLCACGDDADEAIPPVPPNHVAQETTTPTKGEARSEPTAEPTAEPTGDRVVPASTLEPVPMAVGQWTTHRFLNEDGEERSQMTYKIIGEEDDGALWVEVTLSGQQEIAMRVLIKFEDRFDPENVEIREAYARMPNGQVHHIVGSMLQATQQTYTAWMRGMDVQWREDAERETVQVPAGTFNECVIRQDERGFGPLDSGGVVWNHSAVPIMAMVRMHATDGTKIELVDFGLTGAEGTMDISNARELNINIPAGLLDRLPGLGLGMGGPGGFMVPGQRAEPRDPDGKPENE